MTRNPPPGGTATAMSSESGLSSRIVAEAPRLTSPPVPLSQNTGEGEPGAKSCLTPFSPVLVGERVGDRGVSGFSITTLCDASQPGAVIACSAASGLAALTA